MPILGTQASESRSLTMGEKSLMIHVLFYIKNLHYILGEGRAPGPTPGRKQASTGSLML